MIEVSALEEKLAEIIITGIMGPALQSIGKYLWRNLRKQKWSFRPIREHFAQRILPSLLLYAPKNAIGWMMRFVFFGYLAAVVFVIKDAWTEWTSYDDPGELWLVPVALLFGVLWSFAGQATDKAVGSLCIRPRWKSTLLWYRPVNRTAGIIRCLVFFFIAVFIFNCLSGGFRGALVGLPGIGVLYVIARHLDRTDNETDPSPNPRDGMT